MILLLLTLIFAGPEAHAKREPACPKHYAKLGKPALEKLVLVDTDRDLFKVQMKMGTPEDAEAWNRALIDVMDGQPKPSRNNGRMKDLDASQRRKLFTRVNKHPVADSCHVDKYSPDGGIGFCFGRAITAHIEALRMGLDKDSIRKLWIVGGMETSETDWGHHVTTIVRGRNGKWYTIDPNYDGPLTLADWLTAMRADYKNDGRLQMFVTKPTRFGPEGGADAGPILPTTVEDPFYNGYFVDLMAQSRRDAKEMLEQKRLERAAPSAEKGVLESLADRLRDKIFGEP